MIKVYKTQNVSECFELILIMFQALSCSPAMLYFHGRRGFERKVLIRGDSEGRIAMWIIPEITNDKMKLVRQESFYRLPGKR